MPDPPLLAGVVHARDAWAGPGVAEKPTGTLGVVNTVNPPANIALPVSGLVTTTFHVPVAAPVTGHKPDDNVVAFVNVNPVQVIVIWPIIARDTVALATKLVPDTDVIDTKPVLAPLAGEMAVTVGTETVVNVS